jgi:hypothetical protein
MEVQIRAGAEASALLLFVGHSKTEIGGDWRCHREVTHGKTWKLSDECDGSFQQPLDCRGPLARLFEHELVD